jgi:hypothetical protein
LSPRGPLRKTYSPYVSGWKKTRKLNLKKIGDRLFYGWVIADLPATEHDENIIKDKPASPVQWMQVLSISWFAG